MHSAIEVADRLLAFAKQNGHSFTPMQVLKLVFLCHGWMLGLYGRPLVKDQIQAWRYGPVIPNLYHAVKDYRSAPIARPIGQRAKKFNAQEDDVIRQVYEVYGRYDGPTLSNITHTHGSPWDQVFSPNRNMLIKDEIIGAYYERLAREADA